MSRARRLWALATSIVKNRTGAVPRPGWCTYLVTYRCNARCGMCDSWRVKPGTEMTPATVGRVFRELGPLDVVRLTGGEPFLREDMPAIADEVMRASRPSVLHVTTNGSFPDRVAAFAEGFREPRRLSFMVSFDGHREEHDASRGAQVTYDVAMETVRRLAGMRRRGVDVSVNHTVISARSLADGAHLRRELRPLGVDVQSVLAYSDSSMYSIKLRGKRAEHLTAGTGYPLHPRLAEAGLPAVEAFVEDELSRLPEMRGFARRIGKRYYLRGLLARLRGEPSPHRPACVALRSHVRLLPDGRVPVCQFNTETVGNLATQSMADVWNGTAAREARAWVDACPGCWAECEVAPSALYTGEIAREVLALGRPN